MSWGAVHCSRPDRCVPGVESRLSTTHDAVIAWARDVARFPGMQAPGITARSDPGAYPSSSVVPSGESPRVVASTLRCLRERSVASQSDRVPAYRVAFSSLSVRWRPVASASVRVPSRSVAFAYDRASPRSVASALQSSPKVALSPGLLAQRRAAQANKCLRIAWRLEGLAPERLRLQLA